MWQLDFYMENSYWTLHCMAVKLVAAFTKYEHTVVGCKRMLVSNDNLYFTKQTLVDKKLNKKTTI